MLGVSSPQIINTIWNMESVTSNILSFVSPEDLAQNLANLVAAVLQQGIDKKGQASLVVSGGSTPKPFFQHLSRQDIDWQRVTITLADERWVETTESESNEYLVRSLLLQNMAKNCHFIGLKNSAATVAQGEAVTHTALNTIPRPFDLVILGMGDDGHTASLFPGAERLAEAVDMKNNKNCIGITPPEAAFERISMTLPTLLDTNRIILHITGSRKRTILENALETGDPAEMPIRYILRQQITPVHIYWAP